VRRLHPKLWQQKKLLLHHEDTLTFSPGNCLPHSPYSSLFPPLKLKLKGRHFDTVEVIEAKLQAVLNTLTEHDFQNAFKNGRITGNSAYMRTLTVMAASRPKVSFLLDVSTSPGNYGCLYNYVRQLGKLNKDLKTYHGKQ
jgi:hypothetical protein